MVWPCERVPAAPVGAALCFFAHHLHPDSPVYWFMMQIGMVVGFATSFPMNWWLIKRGLKEKM